MNGVCPRCGTQATARLGICPQCLYQEQLPPAVLGGSLELGEEIGHGGMGTVYKARHLRLGRTVAVKFLPKELADQSDLKARFEREARALAMLSHPNIVAVHDFGQEGGQNYIVMEFVEGRPLSKMIPMPVEKALEVGVQVCDSLVYAHHQGVIHRDIKPENILVDPSGTVKVADFGIARIVGPDARGWTVTRANQAVGTPHYMAPEALSGAPPDARMDIYSLGAVLYQLVMGRLPVGNFDPPPPPLDRILLKALSADPGRRYGSAAEMRRDMMEARERSAAEELEPAEMNWLRCVALLQALSTGVALWAFLACVTPKVMQSGAAPPLVMLGVEKLADGRLISRARFETWPILAALATFAVAIGAYGLLRKHWTAAGLQRNKPHQPVREARWVFLLGVVGIVIYGLRKGMEAIGQIWAAIYVPILGGILEIAVLYFLWCAILQAWRLGRPLRREPWMWVGLTLALLPPVSELLLYLRTWQP